MPIGAQVVGPVVVDEIAEDLAVVLSRDAEEIRCRGTCR